MDLRVGLASVVSREHQEPMVCLAALEQLVALVHRGKEAVPAALASLVEREQLALLEALEGTVVQVHKVQRVSV